MPKSSVHVYYMGLGNTVLDGLDRFNLGPFRVVSVPPAIQEGQPMITEPPGLNSLPRKLQPRLWPHMLESWLYRLQTWTPCRLEFRTQTESIPDARRELEQFLGILRLFKYGVAGFGAGRIKNELGYIRAGQRMAVESPEQVSHRPPPYVLTRAELPNLRRHFRRLYPFDESVLGIAWKRFQSFYDRESAVDAFVDLLVCLESILSDRDPVDARYKVAIRGAHFVTGGDEHRKKWVYDLLTHAYRHRSNVLHGRKQDEKWVEEHLHEVWHVARLALVSLIKCAKAGFDPLTIVSDGFLFWPNAE